MLSHIKEQIHQALDATIVKASSVSGGCINQAYCCELADSRRVFVKTNSGCDPTMFALEARGLEWLAEPNAIRIPKVLAIGTEYLVLEYLEGGRASDFEVCFGQGLARLHQAGAESFGLREHNYLATLAQDNTREEDWATFYVERRLRPLLRLAIDQGFAPASWIAEFETLFARMPELIGDAEPPARLHGDLWSGNVHSDEKGAPVLIDPAVYGGHREIDLAMLKLFGSPSRRFFSAYEEVWPLSPGHTERVALYQLYPLLAHVNLFGGGYGGQTLAALRRYV
jgi:fructosamine-3-kinase